MKLAVVSHKPCWRDSGSPSGYATDGGFPRQMGALASLFGRTTLVVPCGQRPEGASGVPLVGPNLEVKPLTAPSGRGLTRKLRFPIWAARNAPRLLRELHRADVVHAAFPGDVGMIGMFFALLLRKRLFVRHCGNWHRRRTLLDRIRRWSMERFAGPARPMFATGAGGRSPSRRNKHVQWIFATSLSTDDLLRCREVRRAPGRSPGRLITVGRQEEGKGTEHVIAALPALQANGHTVHLDVIGGGSTLPELRERAGRLAVSDVVTFAGSVAPGTVLEQLGRSDLFLLLSRSEGFPKVVVEAMACGLPVVATGVSALPELLSSGAGRVVPSTDPRTVAAAVGACLEDDAAYARMSMAALEMATRYSLEAWVAAMGGALARAWGPLQTHEA